MKTLSSVIVIATALLFNTANISQCTHTRKLKGNPLIPPDEVSHPRDILIGSGLPINPVENTQPKAIEDCEEEFQRPTERDLNERRLRRRLGGEIDERFLSVTKPVVMSDEPIVERVSLRGVTTEQKNFLRQVIRNESVPLPTRMAKASVFVERFLMKWLIHKSDCPVERRWKQLGFCYWPRWISLGRCVNKQCSWPHGMSCVPSDPVPVYLLRWSCKSRDGKKGKRSGAQAQNVTCRWLKFRYPVINDCECKCKEKLTNVDERLLPVRQFGK